MAIPFNYKPRIDPEKYNISSYSILDKLIYYFVVVLMLVNLLASVFVSKYVYDYLYSKYVLIDPQSVYISASWIFFIFPFMFFAHVLFRVVITPMLKLIYPKISHHWADNSGMGYIILVALLLMFLSVFTYKRASDEGIFVRRFYTLGERNYSWRDAKEAVLFECEYIGIC
jgi:magnesium-transporting ATPase (P-type)